MTDTTTITPEEKASWRERLESPFSCHDSKHGAFTLRLLIALDTEETRANKLSSQLAKALEVNAADQMEAAIKLFGGIVAAVSGEEMPQDLSVRVWLCPHCGTTHDSKEAAVAHDATCPKHPAVVRAEQAEAELAHVRLAAGSDRHDEVTSDLIDAVQKAEAERDAALSRKDEAEASLAHAYNQISQQADGIEKVTAANHALANKAQTAEAENARLTAQLAALTGQQEDCKLHPCPYSREGLNCGVISLANNRAYEGMVDNTRLRAERDWLVEKLADISDKMNRSDAPTFCAACNICPVGDYEMEGRTCAVAIAEAARRAVSESEVQS